MCVCRCADKWRPEANVRYRSSVIINSAYIFKLIHLVCVHVYLSVYVHPMLIGAWRARRRNLISWNWTYKLLHAS